MKAESAKTIEVIICMGSSCFSRGNNRTLETVKEYLTRNSLENRVLLRGSLCEGRCKDGPNITVGGISYSRVDLSTVIDILEHHLALPSGDSSPFETV